MATQTDPATARRCTGTPTVIVHDNRGLTVRTIRYNRTGDEGGDADECISRQTHTARGAPESLTDPRLLDALRQDTSAPANFHYCSSLSGLALQIHSQDAGNRVCLYDIAGSGVWQQDGNGRLRRHAYDLLHRLTLVSDQTAGGTIRISERLIHGDSAPLDGANRRGRLLQHFTPAGLTVTPAFALTDMPLACQQQFLRDDILLSDWAGDDPASWQDDLTADVYQTRWHYTACGQEAQRIDALGNRFSQHFNLAGRLVACELLLAGQATAQPILCSTSYTATGQVAQEQSGNGMVTVRTYEEQTRRLASQSTSRPAQSGQSARLQSLSYQYDPVGNLLWIGDSTQPTRYARNQQIDASSSYSHDALYQLCEASGRESLDAGQQSQFPPAPIPLQPPDDSVLGNYTRTYCYDRGGNLTSVQHHGRNSYTLQMVVADDSNRAVRQSGNLTAADVDGFFDANGELLELDAGQPLVWNSGNRLQQSTQVIRSGPDDDTEVYWYDSRGQRAAKLTTTQTSGTTRRLRVRYLPGLEWRQTEQCVDGTSTPVETLQVLLFGAAGSTSARLLHWSLGQPDGMDNDQLSYSLNNETGSARMELDAQALVLSWEEYYPYGGTAVWSTRNQTEAGYKYVHYSGKERDTTGLHDFGQRYYASWLMRWISPDPAGTVDGLNLYAMTRNNPVSLRDSNGLQASGLLYGKSFQETADHYNVVLGLRAPNPLGASLLEGGAPSKNFHVKAKSSPTGPTAGFIATEPRYSKVPADKFARQQGYIQDALNKGARSVPLALSQARIDELLAGGQMASLGRGHYRAHYPTGSHDFRLDATGAVFDADGAAVHVLTNPPEVGASTANPGPITADYDRFGIFPSRNQSNNVRPLKLAPVLRRGHWTAAKLPFLARTPSQEGVGEDPNMGNLHTFGQTIVRSLNRQISAEGYGGGKLVWHNDETGNPFSPGFDIADQPIFFIPGQAEPVQVHSTRQLLSLYDTLGQRGYAIEYSPVFGF